MTKNQVTLRITVTIIISIAVIVFVFSMYSQEQNEKAELTNVVTRLEARLAVLENRDPWQRSRSKLSRRLAESGTQSSSGDRADQSNLTDDSATAALQQQIDQMRKALAERGMMPPDPAAIRAATQSILAPATTSMDKLSALRLLRAADARSDEVVLAMVTVYENESDPRIRADVFRQLDGVKTPELRDPLLQAVAEEEVPDVREEAAETLAHFLPDDHVREWLEYLRDNDPNEGVRDQAIRSLMRSE